MGGPRHADVAALHHDHDARAPLAVLIGAGISQGAGKLVNVAMPFAVTWLLANLQPSVIYFAIVGIALVAAIVVIAVGPETRAKRLG